MVLAYWLQLSKRIGPLVLNISRVFTDIITVVASYVVIVIAFTSGLSFVLPTQSFHNILVLLIWSILDPGDKDKDLETDRISPRILKEIAEEIVFVVKGVMT